MPNEQTYLANVFIVCSDWLLQWGGERAKALPEKKRKVKPSHQHHPSGSLQTPREEINYFHQPFGLSLSRAAVACFIHVCVNTPRKWYIPTLI